MEIFKLSHRHRFLKIWLIAIACQNGQLFSQVENHSIQTMDDSFKSNHYYQPPEGISSEEVYTIIYPEDSSRYLTPEPFYPTPNSQSDLVPQNGHWPSFTNNEWRPEEPEHYPSITDWHSSPSQPVNVQSPTTSSNHLQEDPLKESPSAVVAPIQQFSTLSEEEPNPKEIEKKEIEQTNQAPLSLTEGKGNIKFIKKRPESIPPTQRLQEALNQPEEVIGKNTINDPVIGMAEIPKNLEPIENPSQKEEEPIQLKPLSTPSELKVPETSAEDNKRNQNTSSISLDRLETPQLQQTSETAQVTPRLPSVITPTTPAPDSALPVQSPAGQQALKEVSINFNNVAMVEYIRFISRISNKNFIFDDEDLQFNVTIVSEEPTTIENLMTALLQELRIRDLSLIEQGNNIIIHRNPRVRSPARIVSDGNKILSSYESELVTRVFRLNTLDPVKASEIIRPLISEDALIEVLRDTNNLIITDLVTNVNKISQLINTLDAPNSGVTIGQYVVKNAFVDSLVDLANKILQPIAQGNPFVLVPHTVSNSIFIVSNSFIVEKALAILQNLDLNEGRTKILSLEHLQPAYDNSEPKKPSSSSSGTVSNSTGSLPGGGASEFTQNRISGNGYGPSGLFSGSSYGPAGQFPNQENIPSSFPFGSLNGEGRLNPSQFEGPSTVFNPGGIGSEGRPSAIFDENRSFAPGSIGRSSRWTNDLPVGHIERTLFFIYKLRYRKGDNIEIALRKIASSLQLMSGANSDLISAINSIQWIESSNALVFTGTSAALEKVRELILEVDVPLRQVFIEMLILVTTITDSLSYSVDWINRFGGGTTTGEEGFLEAAPGTGIVSADNFLVSSETILNSGTVVPPAPASPLPVATGFMNSGGFVAGVIGTHLTHNGTQFSSLGALVRAIHTDTKADIILNPKVVTEDNNPAEIFVGSTDRYKTQSITNDLGSLVTNNFQFIDVGTTLRVTPLIGNNGIITLEIVQETTTESPTANTGGNNQDVNLVEVLTKTRTVTKIHVPNGFFVILSGMIQELQTRSFSRIPCLGGIPILGCVGKSQSNADNKRNLMLFIRPLIIDTDEDYEDITRRQQDIIREKSKFKRSWNYEVDEALNFGNIKSTDPDDMNCIYNERQQR